MIKMKNTLKKKKLVRYQINQTIER